MLVLFLLFLGVMTLPASSALAQSPTFWAKTYGGADSENPRCIEQTSDGGYIVAGYTESFGAGDEDIWVIKLASNGDVEWQKTYGGSDVERARSIQQTTDGGYIVAGYTMSFGAGEGDFWLLKLTSNGNVEWQKTYGGSDWDLARCIRQTSDGGWRYFIDNARVGITTGQLTHKVANALLEAGAEKAPVGIYSGSHSNAVWRGGARNTRITRGDLQYMHLCGTSFLGYNACLYRSFIVGRKPNDKEKDMYKRVVDTISAAIEATRVGNTTADAAKAFPLASSRGCKDEAEVLTVEFGHGIGIVAYPPAYIGYNLPVVNRQWSLQFPQPFEEGMVVAYETLEGEPGYGGVRMENMVVVTKNGAEIIDFFPRDEILAAGL
ncbi:M24 family metallopeptidase [Chloroflexota bacterium]